VPGQVQIGTRTQGRAETDAGEGPGREPDPAPQPGADGTLLAVVPIPGTGTSLAIVGYPVTAPEGVTPVRVPERLVRDARVLAREALEAAGVVGLPGLLLDHEQRRVRVDGIEVVLTFQEFELLAFLHAHPATVFSRADLVSKVWQRDFAADSRTVDVHVSRLRRKLGPAYGRCLVTEYRVGYQFRPLSGASTNLTDS
jgi:hypothetical protein